MAETIKLVQGDDLPGVLLAVRDCNTAAFGEELDKRDPSTWAVVDLTGAAVSSLVAKAGTTSSIEAVFCTIIDALNGRVLVSFQDSAFLDEAGDYIIELTVDFSNGRQTVYDMLLVNVRERIKNAS